jgi:hypothetical protein
VQRCINDNDDQIGPRHGQRGGELRRGGALADPSARLYERDRPSHLSKPIWQTLTQNPGCCAARV